MALGLNASQATQPANWLIMSEGGCAVNGWTWDNLTPPPGCDRRRGGADGTIDLHSGGRTGLFFDGHAKWIKDENMGTYPSDPR
jgi:prepilin-type processing-associated H-X9-DG protein